ncbi:di-heme oxidoreductase family protein [Pelagibius marinus]|uniref:di-heme oxidoreductase family protein n=1 Tax=Pelagibius marinus TaxID=2762760 RepID=UPI0018723EFE|nr:di-heme oxidoredictase family protein [Pelagibius marinus]
MKHPSVALVALLLIAGGAAAVGAGPPPAGKARIPAGVAPTDDFTRPEAFEPLPGGAATSKKPVNGDAFSHSSANMSFERELDFKIGNGLFRRLWVSAPSSTTSADGLGPLFNARSCQRCHLKDGRGHPPASAEDSAVSMFLRLSIAPQDAEQRALLASGRAGVIPEPTYGGQLQDLAIKGHKAEGKMRIAYEEVPVTLADGTEVSLRRPTYTITDLGYGPLHPDVLTSPRVAPPMIGLGLLEAVYDADIESRTDPDDADGDGISGRVNLVWDDVKQEVVLGRFGWKAGQPTLLQQSSHAINGDIGISAPTMPAPSGDCTAAQADCLKAPNGNSKQHDGLEASAEMLELITFYSRNLAVPARRDLDDPQVLAGKRVFYESGCIGCHRPKYVTRRDSLGEEQSFQLIWPYSDLLLHDMGEGLADHRPEGQASGQEWRTAPLWGIGLTETVNGHTQFLHDGRARNLLEAILWHGGEAEAAKQEVVALPTEKREALLSFLRSL